MRKHEGKLIAVAAAVLVAFILFMGYITMPDHRQAGDLYKNGFVTSKIMKYRELRAVYDIPAKFPDQDIDSVIEISHRYRIPEHIAFNLIHEESRFDSTADNGLCGGYCQLNKKYFTWSNRFDNMTQGFRFLRVQYERKGTWAGAVIYYNSGGNMSSRPAYVNYILYNGRPKR